MSMITNILHRYNHYHYNLRIIIMRNNNGLNTHPTNIYVLSFYMLQAVTGMGGAPLLAWVR